MTDDIREELARELAGLRGNEPWPSNEALGGSPTGTRDDEFRDAYLEQADEVLASPVIARIRAEGVLPDGAQWFPDAGGIQWHGRTYYPADYVLTRNDIARIRAEAWDEAMATARSLLARRSPQNYETDIDLIVETNPFRVPEQGPIAGITEPEAEAYWQAISDDGTSSNARQEARP